MNNLYDIKTGKLINQDVYIVPQPVSVPNTFNGSSDMTLQVMGVADDRLRVLINNKMYYYKPLRDGETARDLEMGFIKRIVDSNRGIALAWLKRNSILTNNLQRSIT